MNNTRGEISPVSDLVQGENGAIATGVINMIMLVGMCLANLKKRLSYNEDKVKRLEHKVSQLQK